MSGLGLLSHPDVRWLISSEGDVKRAIEAFAQGRGAEVVEVAGPPDAMELARYRHHGGKSVRLPCVALRLRMVKHNLTGESGIRVDCDDAGLEELARWRLAALMRRKVA